MIAFEGKLSIRKCAFCKYWWDSVNSAISPKGGFGVWEYEPNIKKKCRIWNQEIQRVISLNANCNFKERKFQN